MSVLQRIVSRRTQLSESGRQIGDWVLANAAQAAAMTSQDLAAWANVSQSSIVKFTQRLGFKGYSEFKLALTEELGRKQVMVNQPLHSNILADDPVAVIAQNWCKPKPKRCFTRPMPCVWMSLVRRSAGFNKQFGCRSSGLVAPH